MSGKRKICVILVDRANYGRMWPVMKAVQEHPSLQLQTVCTGTMLLERFGEAAKVVEKDGFTIDGRVYVELEGSVPATMAKSLGFAIIEMSSEFQRLKPDVVLLIGDRYEALAAALAAAFQNIFLAHIQGGEVSGSIDESSRHAITKFAQIHFPATARAAEYLVRMGEKPETVFQVGCPAGDYITKLDGDLPDEIFQSTGVGAKLSPGGPYFLVIYHPVTTAFGKEMTEAEEVIAALEELQHPTIWLWPNIDAGADHISKCLRKYREVHPGNGWLRLIKNMTPDLFQTALKNARCAIGNSSSFIRDSSFSGTPVVMIGERQKGREVAENIILAPCRREMIRKAIAKQTEHGRYRPSTLYGDGSASKRIAETLAETELYIQKQLHYIFEGDLPP